LHDAIVTKNILAALEKVQMRQSRLPPHPSAETSMIGAIAKTARNNSYEFPLVFQQRH
jgi:hypothetical protein